MKKGTPSGEAFIQMDSELSAEATAQARSRKFLYMNNKKRTIEVIQCSGEDMNIVLTSGLSTAAASCLPLQALQPFSAAHHQIAAAGASQFIIQQQQQQTAVIPQLQLHHQRSLMATPSSQHLISPGR